MSSYALLFLSVFLTAFAQILLKMSANDRVAGRSFALMGSKLVMGYGLLILALVLNVYGLRYVPLSHMAFILPATFILVPVLSKVFLAERLSLQYYFGSLLILVGALVFNLSSLYSGFTS